MKEPSLAIVLMTLVAIALSSCEPISEETPERLAQRTEIAERFAARDGASTIALQITGVDVGPFLYKDARTLDERTFLRAGTSLLIVLGRAGCYPSQIDDLRLVTAILKEEAILIRGLILYADDVEDDVSYARTTVLSLVRVAGIELPAAVAVDGAPGTILGLGRFPVVLLLRDGVVTWAHVPVGDDAEYTAAGYGALRRLLRFGPSDTMEGLETVLAGDSLRPERNAL